MTDVCRFPAQSTGYGTPPAAASVGGELPGAVIAADDDDLVAAPCGCGDELAHRDHLIAARSGRAGRRPSGQHDPAQMPQLTHRSGSTRATRSERRLGALEHRDRPIRAIDRALDAPNADVFVDHRWRRRGLAATRGEPRARRAAPLARLVATSSACPPLRALRERHPEREEEVGRDARRQHERVCLRRHRQRPDDGGRGQGGDDRPHHRARRQHVWPRQPLDVQPEHHAHRQRDADVGEEVQEEEHGRHAAARR